MFEIAFFSWGLGLKGGQVFFFWKSDMGAQRLCGTWTFLCYLPRGNLHDFCSLTKPGNELPHPSTQPPLERKNPSIYSPFGILRGLEYMMTGREFFVWKGEFGDRLLLSQVLFGYLFSRWFCDVAIFFRQAPVFFFFSRYGRVFIHRYHPTFPFPPFRPRAHPGKRIPSKWARKNSQTEGVGGASSNQGMKHVRFRGLYLNHKLHIPHETFRREFWWVWEPFYIGTWC